MSMATKQGRALPVSILAHLTAVALTTLVLVWLLHFRGGFAFKSHVKSKIFNLHPLLMVIGFVLLSGEGMMAYKTVPASRKRQKVVHMMVQLTALIAGSIGVYAVFKYHKESGIMDMYSLHSWFGITTISLFAFQWVFSLLVFLYPGARPTVRARLAPWHALLGIVIFVMMILSAETGLVEKFFFLRLGRDEEALIVNFIALLIFVFALFVSLAIILPFYN